MTGSVVPRRILTAIMSSIAAGVTPRTGIEHLAVGRKEEIDAIVSDLDNVGDGGASFRVVSGPFGSGKSFLLQLARNYALERNYVVMDADLSPDRRFAGTQGQGLATYRELAKNMSTKTHPVGGALATILEKWISGIQTEVMRGGISTGDASFGKAVETRIFDTVNGMKGLVHGFDFAQVITTYWRGSIDQDETGKTAALRWLRGEYATKTEAREALGRAVRVIIDDDDWYDYIKLLASFVRSIGYRGLVVIIDEAVNLYKISHKQARLANYETLLTILNDCLQGRAEGLGILVGATPQMVEDTRRGLFSYDALRTRLQESRYASQAGLRDVSGTVIRLEPLAPEEIFVLLERLRYLHALFYGYPERVTGEQLRAFMEETLSRLGATRFTTPREIVRDFVSVLNLIQQNPGVEFDALIRGDGFKPTEALPTSEDAAASDDAIETGAGAPTTQSDGHVTTKFSTFKL